MASTRKIKGFWFVRTISQRKSEIYTKGIRVLEQEDSSHRSDIGEPQSLWSDRAAMGRGVGTGKPS